MRGKPQRQNVYRHFSTQLTESIFFPLRGKHSTHPKKVSMTTNRYSLPLVVLGMGPTKSTETFSQGLSGFTTFISPLGLDVLGLHFWHFTQVCTYFVMSV